jgi:amidohydrolase
LVFLLPVAVPVDGCRDGLRLAMLEEGNVTGGYAMGGGVDFALADRMIAMRRELHRHPELSWQEHQTAERISSALHRLGIPHHRLGGTGVVAELESPNSLPAVALRADIDALPIQEETGLPFASLNDGVMHACGHDGHTSMLLGAAELLLAGGKLPAPVRLIFQPAEETGTGAMALIEVGVLDTVAVVFGGHLDRHFPTGTLVVAPGAASASTDYFTIRVTGRGGHAARPHETIDAVVVGSLIVTAIQTIVSREIDPSYPSIVTVGRFEAGKAPNVIAGQAVLEGTIRAQDRGVREHLKRSIRRIAESIGLLHQAGLEVEIRDGTPPVVNTPQATALARQAAAEAVGEIGVRTHWRATMGGEDFAYYLQQVPGCYIRIGAQPFGDKGFPAHSSRFDFDEAALPIGANWLAKVALHAGSALRSGEFRPADRFVMLPEGES